MLLEDRSRAESSDHSMLGQAASDSSWCVPSHLKPVVDIPPGVDVQAMDGCPHTLLHLGPLGLTDTPGLGPIEHDVGQDTTGIVRNLNAISLAFQQVATRRKKDQSIMQIKDDNRDTRCPRRDYYECWWSLLSPRSAGVYYWGSAINDESSECF